MTSECPMLSLWWEPTSAWEISSGRKLRKRTSIKFQEEGTSIWLRIRPKKRKMLIRNNRNCRNKSSGWRTRTKCWKNSWSLQTSRFKNCIKRSQSWRPRPLYQMPRDHEVDRAGKFYRPMNRFPPSYLEDQELRHQDKVLRKLLSMCRHQLSGTGGTVRDQAMTMQASTCQNCRRNCPSLSYNCRSWKIPTASWQMSWTKTCKPMRSWSRS